MITLHIKTIDGRNFDISCQENDAILALKQKIHEAQDIDIDRQRLIFQGKVLKDNEQVSSYGLRDGHAVHLVVRSADAPPPSTASAEQPTSTTFSTTQGPEGQQTNFTFTANFSPGNFPGAENMQNLFGGAMPAMMNNMASMVTQMHNAAMQQHGSAAQQHIHVHHPQQPPPQAQAQVQAQAQAQAQAQQGGEQAREHELHHAREQSRAAIAHADHYLRHMDGQFVAFTAELIADDTAVLPPYQTSELARSDGRVAPDASLPQMQVAQQLNQLSQQLTRLSQFTSLGARAMQVLAGDGHDRARSVAEHIAGLLPATLQHMGHTANTIGHAVGVLNHQIQLERPAENPPPPEETTAESDGSDENGETRGRQISMESMQRLVMLMQQSRQGIDHPDLHRPISDIIPDVNDPGESAWLYTLFSVSFDTLTTQDLFSLFTHGSEGANMDRLEAPHRARTIAAFHPDLRVRAEQEERRNVPCEITREEALQIRRIVGKSTRSLLRLLQSEMHVPRDDLLVSRDELSSVLETEVRSHMQYLIRVIFGVDDDERSYTLRLMDAVRCIAGSLMFALVPLFRSGEQGAVTFLTNLTAEALQNSSQETNLLSSYAIPMLLNRLATGYDRLEDRAVMDELDEDLEDDDDDDEDFDFDDGHGDDGNVDDADARAGDRDGGDRYAAARGEAASAAPPARPAPPAEGSAVLALQRARRTAPPRSSDRATHVPWASTVPDDLQHLVPLIADDEDKQRAMPGQRPLSRAYLRLSRGGRLQVHPMLDHPPGQILSSIIRECGAPEHIANEIADRDLSQLFLQQLRNDLRERLAHDPDAAEAAFPATIDRIR